ncbi:MAG: ribosome-recycling factor [Candidatus Roizmanbacteria bacterium]
MNPLVSDFKQSCQRIIAQMKEDLKTIRTGRASASMVEGMIVEAYGGSTKLKLMEMAAITTEGSSLIVIQPFDPATSTEIEKAIQKSPLGLSPSPQGTRILVKIPPLSQEQREKMMKMVSQMIEDKKGMTRNERDNARKKIKAQFDAKDLTEDQKYKLEKDIDTTIQGINDEIQKIKDLKETELMEV